MCGMEVVAEVAAAQENHGEFRSPHEGFAVLKEEVDELWDEVKKKKGEREYEEMREEALHVAAMALRFIVDICP